MQITGHSRLQSWILGCIACWMLCATTWGQEQPTAASPWNPAGLPDFSLTHIDGTQVTKQTLQGKPWVACFFFTRCKGPCPLLIAQMSQLQRETGVTLVAITVDPENDTVDILRNYAAEYIEIGKDYPNAKWYWLTGSKADVFRLIHQGFLQIAYDQEDAPSGFEVAHNNNLMYVDDSGRVRGKYLGTDEGATALLRRIIQGKDPVGKMMPGVLNSMAKSQQPPSDIVDTSIPGLTISRTQTEDESPEKTDTVPAWVRNLPAVNAGLNSLATVLLLGGFVLIKQGRRKAHEVAMLSCFGVSAVFLISYLTYHYWAGHKPFPGTGILKTVYLLILLTHIVLAATVPVLAITTIVLGLRQKWVLHRRWAKVTFPIWLYVSVTGVVIYVMLYRLPING